MKRNLLLLLSLIVLFSACAGEQNQEVSADAENQTSEGEIAMTNLADGLYANFQTSKGNILTSLEFEKTPLTVMNFVGLAEGILKHTRSEASFYNDLIFHRVIDNFMIQGGCPLGNGTGGPGYQFPDEFDTSLRHSSPGILSMANAGPGTNGSQFFITHVETPWLDDKHSVFGRVVEGMDVVNSIKQGDQLKTIEIIRVGTAAEEFEVSQAAFDALLETVKTAATDEKVNEQAEALKKFEADKAFVAEEYSEAVTTNSGLRYIVTQEGDKAASPKMGSLVTVHYTGTFLDGQIFDSSIARGEPVQFQIGQVIEGWNEALMDMTRGEKRLLIIPPALAYGERGYPGAIPPYSFLLFQVELIDFQ